MAHELRAQTTALAASCTIARVVPNPPGHPQPGETTGNGRTFSAPAGAIVPAGDCLPGTQPLPCPATLGEVTERLKVHAWKVCVR